MRFDYALAVNIAQLVSSVAGGAQQLPCSPSTSQFRTANYITHGLPQQCLPTPHSPTALAIADSDTALNLTSTGESSAPVFITEIPETISPEKASSKYTSTPISNTQPEATRDSPSPIEDSDSPLDNAQFLSFEEWREQNLAKAGQSSEDFGKRALREPRRRPAGSSNDLDSLGEDAEIELDFGFEGRNHEAHESGQRQRNEKPSEPVTPRQQGRSKMAGKTGKERTNYASFDCAATVHKTNREVKGSSAILVENKDSYMLNECRAENKFVIVELCDDILVDTVVLANYEFFSSMFKTFRVSVSDRYPVKATGWKELGVFEGRNSREIQAFLVENPQIWARYLKIDFLTHYGNEFYCPISLLRVHGTTMLEEFRRAQEEAARGAIEDDAEDDITEELVEELAAKDNNFSHDELEALAETGPFGLQKTDQQFKTPKVPSDTATSAIIDIYKPALVTGLVESETSSGPAECKVTKTADPLAMGFPVCFAIYTPSPTVPTRAGASEVNEDYSEASESVATPTTSPGQERVTNASEKYIQHAASRVSSDIPLRQKTMDPNHSSHEPPPRHYPAPVTVHAPSPTQESFYKTIHKRLQLLEANATLSLQYIEDQSRMLRDAFAKVEKRQSQKQQAFMEQLNSTIQAELNEYRQQYDQLWQSTVIALENQRRQAELEILAVSSRLAMLADEVIYQKRMSYVHSLLLLVCIALVIFSRSSHLDAPLIQSIRGRSGNALRIFESPPNSPEPQRKSPASAGNNDIDDAAADGQELKLRGGVTRFRQGIISSFTRRRRSDSIDSIDTGMESQIRHADDELSITSPTSSALQSPAREATRSPPSPRPSSPISISSPATPTGTRGRDVDGADEDGWKVFGPNLRVAELKAARHAGVAGRHGQGWQRVKSPLGLYDEGVGCSGKEEEDVGRKKFDMNDEAEDTDVAEHEYKRRKSEPTIKGPEAETQTEGVGRPANGLNSPPLSAPGSPRPHTSAGSSQSQQSQSQSQSQSQGGSQPGQGGHTKGHSRTNSRKEKKKKNRK
ncbi:UNC-like C-terminal-domain-containing protein [Kalaharituber pfeilii]|nr:UNC-like C-terminal-domain-containing protein [Kalaharituber pfeilii]